MKRGGQAAGMAMYRRILLGVDTSLSPPAQLALHVAGELLELSSQDVCLVLLSVIPVLYDPSFSWGKSMTSVHPFSPAPQQHLQAERVLWQARTALQQRGIAPERIEWLQRSGTPTDAILQDATAIGVCRL